VIILLRLLVYSCPPAFRKTYGRDILDMFAARRARLGGSPSRILALWLRTALDIFRTATSEWLDLLNESRGRRPPHHGRTSVTDRLSLDLRDARRRLAAAPGFTVTALVILALGIGGSATIFSAVDAFALRDRPFARPHELVNIYQD
jgi:hypothetical protein